MLQITIPASELYDPVRNRFSYTKEATVALEHSLVSVSKWEAKWKKPFISNNEITPDMFLDYVRCMTLTQHVDPNVYNGLTQANLVTIRDYIADPMTATVISDKKPRGSNKGRFLTSELIYYQMTALNIPFECQKWHLNRLLTLIQIASIEQQPKKKMSKNEALRRQKSLNAARKAKPHL